MTGDPVKQSGLSERRDQPPIERLDLSDLPTPAARQMQQASVSAASRVSSRFTGR